jgi:hypothetical protein
MSDFSVCMFRAMDPWMPKSSMGIFDSFERSSMRFSVVFCSLSLGFVFSRVLKRSFGM